jgi:quinoprotein glucose dehydrogenase
MRVPAVALRSLALSAWAIGSAAAAADDAGWAYYGGTSGGTRYSLARQIDRGNVRDLTVAWRYSTGELKRRGPQLIANSSTETTPILIDGRLIFCTPFNRLIALDPATGRERWVMDAEVDLCHKLPYHYNCRGVSFWRDPDAAAAAECAVRIFMGTNDSRIVAVDAHSGRRCRDFGKGGEVSIERDRPAAFPGEVKITSAPVVARGVVAVGSFVMDNIRTDAPSGTVFAVDARSGALRWKFEPIPRDPGDPAMSSWEEGSASRTGAANVWSTMVADEKRGIIYAPVGSASPDFFGGERKGDNLYSSSLVALDAATGRTLWNFQSVHHDVWDYDVSAPPLLADVKRAGTVTPVVVQNTKQGFVWILERETGKSVFGVVEKLVPQHGLPGEWLTATQPFPLKPEPLVPTTLRPEDAWGFTFWDRRECRKKIESMRSDGIFTPASLAPGTILMPGSAGGMNWGGAAYDPERQTMIVNVNRAAQVVVMIPRKDIPGLSGISLANGTDVSAAEGTPYGVHREWLLSPLGAPCSAPPWGELVAVSLVDGSVKWRVPLGSIEKSLPIRFEWNLGTPNLGGPIITASGLIFIAATMDNYLRAFDADNGKMLWRTELPAGGQATPMTYQIAGRQFLVMVTGHHLWFGSKAGDEVLAYALPVTGS